MPFGEACEHEKFLTEPDMYDLLAIATDKIAFALRARAAGTWHRCDVKRTLRFANLDILRMLTRDMENIAAQPVIQFLDRCV